MSATKDPSSPEYWKNKPTPVANNLEYWKTLKYDASQPFKHQAQPNNDTKELESMVTTAEELEAVLRSNDSATRVKHTLAFKGYKTKYITSFLHDNDAWGEVLDKLTMRELKLLAYLQRNCMFGYNWIVFNSSIARESLGQDKSAVNKSLKALLEAGAIVENPTCSIEFLEMADLDLTDAEYFQHCKTMYEVVTGSRWTPYHRIFRLNYRIAWYGRLMWLMKSPSTQFASNFKGRSAEFVGAYNLYGTLPGLLFGLKESAGLQAWERYFELLKEAKQAGAGRPGVVYVD